MDSERTPLVHSLRGQRSGGKSIIFGNDISSSCPGDYGGNNNQESNSESRNGHGSNRTAEIISNKNNNLVGGKPARENHLANSDSLNLAKRFIRRPFHYDASIENCGCLETSATANRHKYYNKLKSPGDEILGIPDHVVPSSFFYEDSGKQSSLVTIFAVWNTMMGSSLLVMPWALGQAGFAFGILLIVLVCAICLYTAFRITNMAKYAGLINVKAEFSEQCSEILGPWAKYIALFPSLLSLLGACIVYWILCANFLHSAIYYLHDYIKESETLFRIENQDLEYEDVVCNSNHFPSQNMSEVGDLLKYLPAARINLASELFKLLWDLRNTVPFYLVILFLPLVNFKSPTFFTKFNALGAISVMYTLGFVAVKAFKWKFHLNLVDIHSPDYSPNFRISFTSLTGILALSYFIHNCIVSIMQNQRTPSNNNRDLAIAFSLVCLTYAFIGVVFYSSFPLPKDCIEDNLLNNITYSDFLAFLCRLFLFFQLFTVFPLLLYMFRVQVLQAIFGNIYPGFLPVFILNVIVVIICVLFAVLFPSIGTIVRFVGSFCGMIFSMALPCLTFMVVQKKARKLTCVSTAFHCTIIAAGVANFTAQFFN